MSLAFSLPGHDHQRVTGVDEAGRGPLAGDVVAAAVVLDRSRSLPDLRDSKKFSARQRAYWYERVREQALAHAVIRVSPAEIDRLNILQASLFAMREAVASLEAELGFVYVDGNRCPDWSIDAAAVIGGDGRIQSVAAASVLAKVTRDHDMLALDEQYPDYGFARHKGYPTREHIAALQRFGPCDAHRRSYKPVARILEIHAES